MQKLFIIVSNQLDLPYQGVQGGHVVAQWLLDNKDTQTWNNGTVIYLESDRPIERWLEKLQRREVQYSRFIEPDVDNAITAFAVLGHDKLFKHLKLMGWRYAAQHTAAMVA
jgi:hypothetical protein